MRKPELMKAITIGDIRKEAAKSLEQLQIMGNLLSNGYVFPDVDPKVESIINMVMTDAVLQQEYVRDGESRNWGLR